MRPKCGQGVTGDLKYCGRHKWKPPEVSKIIKFRNAHARYFKVPLCMVDLAQTIEEWKDLQSVKVDDQVGGLRVFTF